jgi:hypothetical protein
MKKIVRLTESDLTRLVKRVINETKEEGFKEIKTKSALLKVGKEIQKAKYNSRSGEFILVTPTHQIKFGCAGGADITVDGDDLDEIKNTSIKNASIKHTEIRLTFDNGSTIFLEDETGGEGIEIYIV